MLKDKGIMLHAARALPVRNAITLDRSGYQAFGEVTLGPVSVQFKTGGTVSFQFGQNVFVYLS